MMAGRLSGLSGALLSALLLMGAWLTIKPALHAAGVSAAAVGLFLFCLTREARREMMPRALVIVILMPVIAWSLSNPWLLYAAMLVWVPLLSGGAGRVVPVYLFSLLLLPGLDSTVHIGSLKLFEFGVHDALAAGAALALFLRRDRQGPGFWLDLPACCVILLIAGALSRDTSFSNLLRFTSNIVLDLGLPYYIASRGLRDRHEFRRVLLWLGCGAVTLGSLLAYEAFRAWPIYNELYQRYQVMILLLVKWRGGYLRAGGPFVESTSAAMVLAICIMALWACRRDFRPGWHGPILLLALVGLVAPQSRGAWIGLLFALAIYQLYLGRYAQLLKGGALVAGLSALLFTAALTSPGLSETLGLSGGSSDTSDYRRALLDRGMEEFWHSPIIGYSMNQINMLLPDLRQGEGIIDFVNSYIWIVLISGSVGLTIFLGAFLSYMFGMRRYRRASVVEEDGRETAAFLFASLCMMMEMLFFTSFGTRPAVFVFVLFGFAAAFLHHHRRAAPGPVQRPLPRIRLASVEQGA